MISGLKAMLYLRLSDRVFFPAVKHEILVPQMRMPRQGKTEYNFVIAYLDEVAKVLPLERKKGLEVFTPTVIEKLKAINKVWNGKKDVDWQADERDTDRVLKSLSKRKRK